ncbi:sigma-E factor negative regulatory protein [Marinospirillum perlucidum]|uniref:sigma-E factor negative regulatory protein n=1 Tax=Marinospirillum perlucidum TaxID=1982602 RepID=UPI000DF3CF1B|nr:sigma-E factor negative regulatory protein [Marinospirillum perlucidum]
MTEKLHQSLSSIMDAAGDDLELPRLLNAMQASPELEEQLGEKWRRYHLAQGIMQGDLRGMTQPQFAQVDISARVMQELEAEASEDTPAESLAAGPQLTLAKTDPATAAASSDEDSKRTSEKMQWFRGGALAASVALLVVTGVQVFNASKEVVQPGGAPAMATQPAAHPAQELQTVRQELAPAQPAPWIQVSVSPFEPQAFTGRSLVGYSQGQEPLQSSSDVTREAFSPVKPEGDLQQAASAR